MRFEESAMPRFGWHLLCCAMNTTEHEQSLRKATMIETFKAKAVIALLLAGFSTKPDAVVAKIKELRTGFFFQLHDVLTPGQCTWLAQHRPSNFGHDGGAILGEAAR